MLIVEKLNISFDKTILKNGKISVYDNELTVVFGDSGCGKTSLLYCLGLFFQENTFSYIFNGSKIDLSSDDEKGSYKKKHIGFIFQENNLFENLTLYENIAFNLKLADCEVDDKAIDNLLSEVDLLDQKYKYPRQLSGGEQQRAAILSAIAKRPELLIVDEPTSSLDNTNAAKIIKLLKSYAYEGHMVIVSSHDNRLREASDRTYEIIDKKIVEAKSPLGNEYNSTYANENVGSVNTQCSSHAIRYYNRHNTGKKGISNIIMIVLCSLVIAFGGLLSSFGDTYAKSQNEYLNKISEREMLVVNWTAPTNQICDCDANISLTDEEVVKLQSIHHIIECYPYYEFKSYGYDCVNGRYVEGCKITLNCDGTITESDFQSTSDETFTLIAYYKEKDISKALKNVYNEAEEGVYISSLLAEKLGISGSEQNISVTVEYCVPVGIEKATLRISDSEDEIITDTSVYLQVTKTYCVNGILDDSIQNNYSLEADNTLYLNYDVFTKVLEDAYSVYMQNPTYKCDPLRSSAYVVFVDDYSMISPVKESIQHINPDFRIQSNYQDVKSMQEMMQNTTSTMKLVFWLVLGCIFIMMSIIQMNRIVARKYEIALLRADGFSNREIRLLTCLEACESAVLLIILSILFAWIYSNAYYLSSSLKVFEMTVPVIISIVLLSILATSIPTLLTVICFQRYQPATVMRNK